MESLKLIDIDKTNWETFCLLCPGEKGRKFVSSNAYSLTQAHYEGFWITKGITHENQPVGFTMFGFDQENKRFELCRLMIDSSYQGKGYGKKVISIIISEMINRFQCHQIFISAVPENSKAITLYQSCGFEKTGEIFDGEVVLCLTI